MATENLEINIGANTQDLQTGLNQASQSVQNFGNAVKTNLKPTADATNALSNLSRVAQDAPYGFMGIANNLNPLLESFQRLSKESGGAGSALKALVGGLTGPAGIGLALGAISSLVVAFGDDIANWIASTTELEKANKQLRTSFLDTLKTTEATIANDQALVSVITDVTQSTEAREAALNKLKSEYKGNIDLQKTDIEDGAKLEEIINKISNALVRKAQIEGTAKIIGEKTAELVRLQTADLEEQIGDLSIWTKSWDFLNASLTGGSSALQMAKLSTNLTTDALAKNAEQTTKTQKVILSLKESLKELTKASFEAGDYSTLSNTGPTKVKTNQDVDTSYLDLLKTKQKLYKQDFDEYKKYADLIVLEELRIALEKAKINKASEAEILNINQIAKTKLIQNEIDLKNSYAKVNEDIDKETLANQLQASKESIDIIKRQYDIEEKLAAEDYDKKRAALKKAMGEIQILMALSSNPKAIKDLEKFYNELKKIFDLTNIDENQKNTKKLQEGYEKFAKTIASDVTGAFVSMYDAMQQGKNPLQALGDYFSKLAEQIAAAAIQAALFQGIMMLLSPESAGSFGTGFFEGFKKILGFAEGGIVSQPTIAMVGEGGQSEAIMPLNKLGNMMNSTFNAGAMSGGGNAGNGQFVLKGQDLILAINRSNASLNLRRGF